MNFNQDQLLHESRTENSKVSEKLGTALDEHCPSCLESLPEKVSECPGCGVIFAQFHRVAFEKKIKTTVGGVHHLGSLACEDLRLSWEKVEAMYADTESHHEFIHQCYKQKALPFAVKMYSERIEANPRDEVADIMRFRALTLCQESLPEKVRSQSLLEPHSSFLFRLFRFVFIMMGICGTLMLLASFFLGNSTYYMGLGFFLLSSGILAVYFIQNSVLDAHLNKL